MAILRQDGMLGMEKSSGEAGVEFAESQKGKGRIIRLKTDQLGFRII